MVQSGFDLVIPIALLSRLARCSDVNVLKEVSVGVIHLRQCLGESHLLLLEFDSFELVFNRSPLPAALVCD